MVTSQKSLIRAITDSKLPLKVCDKGIWDDLLKRRDIDLRRGELRSGRGIIVADGFSRCQGIAFYDKKTGAFAHNDDRFHPYYIIHGECMRGEGCIAEDPRRIYKDRLDEVVAVHVRHRYNYSYLNTEIRDQLISIGIPETHIFNLIIDPTNKSTHRNIALDVPEGKLYVFPNCFDYGLCLDLNKFKARSGYWSGRW